MLPQPHISAEENIPPMGRKVYINPNFHSQLQGRGSIGSALQPLERPAIHINPHFLQRQQEFQMQQLLQQQQQHVAYYEQTVAADLAAPPAKIISKVSTCLVRKQHVKTVPVPVPVMANSPRVQPPLVSISKRKLVRQGATIAKAATTSTAPAVPLAKRTKYKLVRAISLTSSSSTPLVKKRRTLDFVARYALNRTNETSAIGKKFGVKKQVLKPSVNKSLCMVSIHGVMYKKTAKNKLTKVVDGGSSKADVRPQLQKQSSSTGCTLFVRGTKFVMDPSGCRLTRLPTSSTQLNHKGQRLRIDIGGLTYISSPKTQNVLIRTTNHVSRAHLMTAKHRSLQLLNRTLVKTNVPCAIFQRLGKCAAHSRGKCRRLHDKRQVAICPSFLRGECTKDKCLLSHNVTLEKMPVCRYYLRGVCVREDCPYLHKKLSRKAEICIDFLRGYCARAADCNMRHEFVCPEFARLGKCDLTNCSYCKLMKSHKFTPTQCNPKSNNKKGVGQVLIVEATHIEEMPNSSRYFKCESDKCEPESVGQQSNVQDDPSLDEDVTSGSSVYKKRPKLGTLPAFIPLGDSEE